MELIDLMSKAGGNPGAMNFLMAANEEQDEISKPLFDAIERIPTLRGTNIYILCSDLGNSDFNTIAHLCSNCPDDILEDAFKRQDYTGRELVKDYMPK